ncbi:MAG: thymidylate kinase [Akkermansiaceae bacterium]|jgi:thymidylate kinase|tara:strand:- start:188 stop:1456 length:1269 start_codon:yes stop_codon:yes gene_type:complete
MNLRTKEGLQAYAKAGSGNVAFLRFERGGLEQGPLSDWDIAVRDRSNALIICENQLGTSWLRIPRRYVIQHFFKWGQVDLLPVFEWNGLEYLDRESFWDGVSVSEDGIPRPALGHDAFIAWMTGLLWGARFNSRYTGFVKLGATEDEANFRSSLEVAFGGQLAESLYQLAAEGKASEATNMVGKLRVTLWLRRLRSSPLKTLKGVARHWFCELGFHWRTPYPWVGILGPDGSGKSSVIEGLTEKLKLSRIKMRAIHWLPQLSRNAETSTAVVTDPHARPPKSSFLSLLQLGKIVVVWWIAMARDLVHLRAKQSLVLSDRFYPDLLADPRRYRYGAGIGVAKWVFKLIPKPDRVIILHTAAETILKRKQEVAPAELERQLKAYHTISEDWGDRAVLVDCGQELDEVVERVFETLVLALAKRTR